MTTETNKIFKENCEELISKIEYLVHGVDKGVITYNGLMQYIDHIDCFSDEIKANANNTEKYNDIIAAIQKLQKEIKDGRITATSIVNKLNSIAKDVAELNN